MALHNDIGKIGEGVATEWLKNKSFEIVERNYRKKWGEIDIVARETTGKVHFVEVKTVSYETKLDLDYAVSHETWRPEEKVHFHKQQRLARAIQTWISENKYEGKWQIDIIVVRLVPDEKYCRLKLLDNIIFDV